MFFRKTGFPQDADFVICTVTKIQFNSVFVRLDEYDKQGMIHISEISPGRIRNIRDYVREGKVVVCVVLRVNQERGQIDLSLRRVNETQRRLKLNEMKQEQKAEKILEIVALNQKKDLRELYGQIINKISDKYSTLYSFFEDIVADKASMKQLELQKGISDALEELVRQRIKLPEVEIEGILYLTSYQPNGVELVKNALKKLQDTGAENVTLQYVGTGKYPVKIKAEDYKTAEKILKKSVDSAIDYMSKNKSEGRFERLEK